MGILMCAFVPKIPLLQIFLVIYCNTPYFNHAFGFFSTLAKKQARKFHLSRRQNILLKVIRISELQLI